MGDTYPPVPHDGGLDTIHSTTSNDSHRHRQLKVYLFGWLMILVIMKM